MLLCSEGHRETHGNICGSNKLKKAHVQLCWLCMVWQAQAAIVFNLHTIFSWMPISPPPQKPFIMEGIIWHSPSISHENDELSYKSVMKQTQTKNIPVSQGNLHTILISSSMATKDRKWVRGHQWRQSWKGGQDVRGRQFEYGYSCCYWRSTLNTNVTDSFKAQKKFWQS